MSSRRQYPVSKPFLPPPEGVTAAPTSRRAAPSPATSEAAPSVTLPEKPASRRLWLLAAVLLGLTTAAAVTMLKRGRAPVETIETARQRLRDLQRHWWETEGLGTTPASDPAVAFERLIDRQREWWDTENLAAEADIGSSDPLDRLEKLEQAWWEFEELAKGQAAKDPRKALAQLDHLTNIWWKEVKPARLPDAGPPEGSTGDSPPNTDVELIDRENTRAFLQAGGTEQSERAVQLGLQWLARQQHPDGHWESNGRFRRARGQARYAGSVNTASTALALLAFLGHGQTHRAVEGWTAHAKLVENGLNFLRVQQKADGDLSAGRTLYVHALATIALCEAYNATADPLLKDPCQKAIDFLVAAQGPRNGGWRYLPGMAGDLSVTSWCLMALKSGQMGGLSVPTKTLDRARAFLRRVSRPDGGYNYIAKVPGHSPPTPAVMTAAGIVCRQYLQRDEDVRSPEMTRGIDVILAHPPREDVRNFYYYYYATYALLPVGGDAWQQWNPKVRDLLVSWQDKGDRNPELRGSWSPEGTYQLQAAGRVGVTALALLTLEVYYRHLPLNRPELGEMAKPRKETGR